MNQYRAGNLLNIQRSPRVRVIVNAPKVVTKPKHNTIQSTRAKPVHRIAPQPTPAARIQQTIRPAQRNRPVTITPMEQRAGRPQPVGLPGRVQRVVSPNRSVSLAENRRGRSQQENLQQYVEAIMRLKNIGIGRIMVILANGPSVNEIPIEKLGGINNIDIMCINKPNQKVWPTKFWSFCDQSQYQRNTGVWEQYTGTVINATAVRARHRRQVLIKNLNGTGFSKDLTKGYYIGRSSTYAGMQIAMWMNYDKVFIFGCDMSAVNGKLHFYGQNPDVKDDHRIERFKQEGESFLWAANNLNEAERERFVFCSNYNKFKFTDYFAKLDHLTAIESIMGMAKNK